MTAKCHDEDGYLDLPELALTAKDFANITEVLNAWADASADADLRTAFLASLCVIKSAGPAYCRLAAYNLIHWAGDQVSVLPLDQSKVH